MKRYIHYNSNAYDKERLKKALTKERLYRSLFKPHGLWASPVNAEIGWKEWCEDQDFHVDRLEKSFEFTLSPKAKVLTINKLEDAEDFLLIDSMPRYTPLCRLNHSLIYSRYDAMEVRISSDYIRLRGNNVFYGWDVDSICIWNPDIIVTEEGAKSCHIRSTEKNICQQKNTQTNVAFL